MRRARTASLALFGLLLTAWAVFAPGAPEATERPAPRSASARPDGSVR